MIETFFNPEIIAAIFENPTQERTRAFIGQIQRH